MWASVRMQRVRGNARAGVFMRHRFETNAGDESI